MSLLIFRFWTVTALNVLLQMVKLWLLKEKAIELLLNMDELKHKVGFRAAIQMITFKIASNFN